MAHSIIIAPPIQPAASYSVWIEAGLLERVIDWLPMAFSCVVIISDTWVNRHYGRSLEQALRTLGKKTLRLTMPRGEKHKNIRNKCRLEQQMLAFGCDRDSLIIALGGGVIGDLAGFIAATYMRGIAYIQVPTTLLAMVDSSVGGKTAIDTAIAKNVIGAFWQPTAVIADIHCLNTLPRCQLINGLIEAIKMFLSCDRDSLDYVHTHIDAILLADDACLTCVVQRAVRVKASIVEQDERENRQRVVLNWGHTIGHALEQLSAYQLLHGYAVALGCLVEAKIAHLLGHLSASNYQWIESFFKRLDIGVEQLRPYAVDAVIQQTYRDKKKRAGAVHYVLLTGLGRVYSPAQVFAHAVPDDVVKRAFLSLSEG